VLHPPEPGKPGKDVFGSLLHARDGRPFELAVGENVEIDKAGRYVSTYSGMVLFVGGELSVTDVFATRGDVNMVVGNITVEKGSVYVRGTVLSGFSVVSPANVMVDDAIENATVQAGGSVEVKGGVIMDKGGSIRARGHVQCMYAANADIRAGGDVIVAHEISNCKVFAGGKVIAMAGRGKIIGGVVQAVGGVEANEIGSELGVETILYLGQEVRANEELIKRKREIEKLLSRIYASLGSDDPKAIYMRAPPSKRETIGDILKTRIQAEQELLKIDQTMNAEREEMRRRTRAKVKVYKTLYPNVVINCFGAVFKSDRRIFNSTFYYTPESNEIVCGAL